MDSLIWLLAAAGAVALIWIAYRIGVNAGAQPTRRKTAAFSIERFTTLATLVPGSDERLVEYFGSRSDAHLAGWQEALQGVVNFHDRNGVDARSQLFLQMEGTPLALPDDVATRLKAMSMHELRLLINALGNC